MTTVESTAKGYVYILMDIKSIEIKKIHKKWTNNGHSMSATCVQIQIYAILLKQINKNKLLVSQRFSIFSSTLACIIETHTTKSTCFTESSYIPIHTRTGVCIDSIDTSGTILASIVVTFIYIWKENIKNHKSQKNTNHWGKRLWQQDL